MAAGFRSPLFLVGLAAIGLAPPPTPHFHVDPETEGILKLICRQGSFECFIKFQDLSEIFVIGENRNTLLQIAAVMRRPRMILTWFSYWESASTEDLFVVLDDVLNAYQKYPEWVPGGLNPYRTDFAV